MALPVFVIHWNAPEWCAETVRSIEAATVEVQLTVIDNSSNYLGTGSVVRPGRNIGFSGAGNVALRAANEAGAGWCVIACHDAVVAPDALEHLLDARRPGYAILGAVLDRELPPWAKQPDLGGIVSTETIIGTLMLVDVAAALAVGGFDERFGSYYEEVDLCFRVRRAGHHVGFVSAAHVNTKGSSSPSAEALKRGNDVLFALKVEGRLPAMRKVAILARDFLRAALSLVVAPSDAARRACARMTSRALVIGAAKLVRYSATDAVSASSVPDNPLAASEPRPVTQP